MAEWEEWVPSFAPHVKGRYERREFDPRTKMPVPQTVKMECTVCGTKWATVCSTGQVRTHIARFASLHLHRDPLAVPK